MNKKPVNRNRHEASCTVCRHPQLQQIEREWCSWTSTLKLAKEYHLSKDSLYRHAVAMGLFERRARNLKGALEKIIEKVENVDVNASAIVSAIQAYAKINAQGAWVDRVEQVNLNDLFNKMTAEELEAYARDGTLPPWFEETVGAKSSDDSEGGQNAQTE